MRIIENPRSCLSWWHINLLFGIISRFFLFLYHLPQHLKEIKPDDHAVDALGQLKGGYTISQMMAGPTGSTGSTADARDVVPRPRLRSVDVFVAVFLLQNMGSGDDDSGSSAKHGGVYWDMNIGHHGV